MDDPYQHWRDNLAGKEVPIHDGEAHPGFYRRKRRGGGYDPAAIFYSGDELVCIVGGKLRDPAEEWQWLYSNPIREDVFRAVAERGEPWPDIDASVQASITAPSLGRNEPADEAEIIRDQIESAKAGADEYASITSDEQAARAQSLRSRLLELGREADKKREAEKKPHLEAGKSVDAKWQPLVRAAKEVADRVAKAMGAWETQKARAAAEAARKAEEERRWLEEEARKAAEAGKPAPEPAPLFQAPEPSPAPATQIRGGYGRAASVRVVKVARVIDQDATYGFLRTHPELADLIARLAQRAIDKGHEVPGVEIEEQRRVA